MPKYRLLVALMFFLLAGCFDSVNKEEVVKQTKDSIFEKMKFDGIYFFTKSGKLIELELREEAYHEQGGYGFKREYFNKSLSKDELANATIYVKNTKQSADFDVRIGQSGDLWRTGYGTGLASTQTRHKIHKTWGDHYCHGVDSVHVICEGGNAGFKTSVTTFRSRKVKDGIFEINPIKNIPQGNYFFWFKTAKINGFTQGFPFSVSGATVDNYLADYILNNEKGSDYAKSVLSGNGLQNSFLSIRVKGWYPYSIESGTTGYKQYGKENFRELMKVFYKKGIELKNNKGGFFSTSSPKDLLNYMQSKDMTNSQIEQFADEIYDEFS